jgi:hypothetical protein
MSGRHYDHTLRLLRRDMIRSQNVPLNHAAKSLHTTCLAVTQVAQ